VGLWQRRGGYTAVRTWYKFGTVPLEVKKTTRCGHNHQTGNAAHRCGEKNLPNWVVLSVEASDGKPVTLADLVK